MSKMKLKLPADWNSITIEHIQKIHQLERRRLQMDVLEYKMEFVSILSDMPLEQLSKVTLTGIRQAYESTEFVLTSQPEHKVVQRFEHACRVWLVSYDIKDINGVGYELLKKLTESEEKIFDNLPLLFSLFCTPHYMPRKKVLFGPELSPEAMSDQAKASLLRSAPFELVCPLVKHFKRLIDATMQALMVELEEAHKDIDSLD